MSVYGTLMAAAIGDRCLSNLIGNEGMFKQVITIKIQIEISSGPDCKVNAAWTHFTATSNLS